MLRSRQCDTPATTPVTTLARLTEVDTAPGLMPVLSKRLDDVGPKPMPSTPSTIAAKKPASATTTRSPIERKSYRSTGIRASRAPPIGGPNRRRIVLTARSAIRSGRRQQPGDRPTRTARCRSVWCSRRRRSVPASPTCGGTGRASRSSASPTSSPTTTCSAPTPRPTRRGAAPTTSTPRSTSRSCCSATSPRAPRLELVTGVIILPQRQTALVAKQAAEVDLLTDGTVPPRRRHRLERGRVRGARRVVRRPWAADVGADPAAAPAAERAGGDPRRRVRPHHGAGLAPLPLQRPIPIWIGGQSAPAYRRVGRLADGWFPQVPPGPKLDEARAIVAEAAVEAGRDPATLGMEGRVSWSDGRRRQARRPRRSLARRRRHPRRRSTR